MLSRMLSLAHIVALLKVVLPEQWVTALSALNIFREQPSERTWFFGVLTYFCSFLFNFLGILRGQI